MAREDTQKFTREIIEKYDTRVLQPRFGKGTIRYDLLRGLEEIAGVHIDKPRVTSKLDEPFDYNALRDFAKQEGEKTASGIRANNFVVRCGVGTYRDLIGFLNSKDYKIKKWQLNRNFGKKSRAILFRFLNSIGVNLFDRDYTSEELGERER